MSLFNFYQGLISDRWSPNRLVSSITHAMLGAGGSGLAAAILLYFGIMPRLLDSPIRASFGVAAYSLFTGVASYRAYGRPRRRPTNTPRP